MKAAPQQRSVERVLAPTGKMSTSSLSSRSPGHRLQQAIGNAATARLFKSGHIQPKLTVSHPEDESEREADRVADQVMRMPEPASGSALQRSPVQIQRMCTECEDELQRKPEFAKDTLPEEEEVGFLQAKLESPSVADATHINRTCEHCEDELQHKAQPESNDEKLLSRKRESGNSTELPQLESARPHSIQPKLTVSHRGDEYELEADRIADQVMGMPSRRSMSAETSSPQISLIPIAQREYSQGQKELQREPLIEPDRKSPPEDKAAQVKPADDEGHLQRKLKGKGAEGCTSCEEEEHIQTKEGGGGTDAGVAKVESRIGSTSGGGERLPEPTRKFFENRFGRDFSNVRVHADSPAIQMNREINARAFTHQEHIYFNAGEYPPTTEKGKHILAHELTHVVQQNALPVSRPAISAGLSISDPSDPYKQAASETAKTFVQQLPNNVAHPSSLGPPRPNAGSAALIQRDEAEAVPAKTPAELIASYTNFLGDLDEKKLGEDLATRLPAQSTFVNQVFNLLPDSDQDDVAYEITLTGNIASIPGWLRIKFVGFMVTGIVTDEEEGAIANLWISFEPGLPKVAEENRDLWKKSLWESDQLVAHVKPITDSFSNDVTGLARAYLAVNKKELFAEANRYGIDLEGGKSITPTRKDYLAEVQSMVPGVVKLKNYLEELKRINVGYYKMSDCMAGDCKHPSTFNPERKPMMEPEGTESPAWPKWTEVKVQYDRTSALISAFASHYPSIYLLIQQDKLEKLSEAGDAAKAQAVILETLQKTGEKIDEADTKIATADITYYDLKIIQNQLFSGSPKITYIPRYPWNQSYYQDIANDDIEGHASEEFWANLGLTAVAAAALIAAPFTGGASAAFLVGFGIGIGAAQAGISWEKYLDMSTVGDAKVKEELTLISKGEVNAQLVDALVQTVGVFLDLYGAKAILTGAKQGAKALAAAEKGLKQELTDTAAKRALSGAETTATKEAAEKEALGQMSALAKEETKGSSLARKLGYPEAEPGYHWAEVNGKPAYRRNPLRAEGPKLPERVYDPETKTFKNVETKVTPTEPLEGELTNLQKGKFGEQQADAYMAEKGFIKRGSHDMPGPGGGKAKPQGIDGVYEKTNPPPKWVVGEAKYGESGYGKTASGKQLSEPWTDARLDHAVGEEMANKIRVEGYERWELRVDAAGKVTSKKITW
jgi:hypothetical protein